MKEKIKKLKEKIAKFCSDKQRVYAAILAVLMIFWTIGSLFGIISFCSSKAKKTGLTVLAAAADEPTTVAETEETTGEPDLNAIYDDMIYGSVNGANFFNPSAAAGYYSSSGVIAPYGSNGVPYGFKVYSFDDTFTGGSCAVLYGNGRGVLGSITRIGYYTLSFDAGEETDSIYFRLYACDDSGAIKLLSFRNGDTFYISDEFLTHSAYTNTTRASFGIFHDTGFPVGSTRIGAIQVTQGTETYDYSPYFYFDNESLYETGFWYGNNLGYDEGYEVGIDEGETKGYGYGFSDGMIDGFDDGLHTENTGIFLNGTIDIDFCNVNGTTETRGVTDIGYSSYLLNSRLGGIHFFDLPSYAKGILKKNSLGFDTYNGTQIVFHFSSEYLLDDIEVAATSYGEMSDSSFFNHMFKAIDEDGNFVYCEWVKVPLTGFDYYRLDYTDGVFDSSGNSLGGIDSGTLLVCALSFAFDSNENDCHLGLFDENVTDYVKEVQRYYDDGMHLGTLQGFKSGSALTDEKAYQNGYTAGYADGSLENGSDYQDGYDTGYAFGYNVGSVEGYNSGLATGIEKHNDYTFMGLIGSAFDVPLNAFKSMFDFEVLGVNLQSFFLSLLTCCVCLAVLKVIF